jgi:hypothetical protein
VREANNHLPRDVVWPQQALPAILGGSDLMPETRRGVVIRETVNRDDGGTGSVLECTVCGSVFAIYWDAEGRLVNAAGEELAGPELLGCEHWKTAVRGQLA